MSGRRLLGALLLAGADKVSVNTAALLQPDLIDAAAGPFGSQCIVLAIDARRDPTQSLQGHNLVLTLDQNIQYLTETALVETVKEYKAKSGIAIVMEPGSGAILAMAHAPLFNPNAYDKSTKARWRNRAVTDVFEPGSPVPSLVESVHIDNQHIGQG